MSCGPQPGSETKETARATALATARGRTVELWRHVGAYKRGPGRTLPARGTYLAVVKGVDAPPRAGWEKVSDIAPGG